MRYSYFPGCSLHSTGLEYGLSTQAVFRHLGMGLTEILNWNCCGASSAHTLDHLAAIGLPARTLAIAQEMHADLVTPCAACFNRLKGVDHALRNNLALRAEIEQLVGFKFTASVVVRPVLMVLYEDYGLEKLAAQVCYPLQGLKLVTYYGCLLVRPEGIVHCDDPDNPQVMARLLGVTGAEVRSWSYATDCCGGSLSLSRSDIVQHLVQKLADRASEAGAEAIVTACPLCQVNLEMRQTSAKRIPTFYFTELLGLALGLSEASSWWGKHLIDPRPVLNRVGLLEMRV